jgi:hypothetical protein
MHAGVRSSYMRSSYRLAFDSERIGILSMTVEIPPEMPIRRTNRLPFVGPVQVAQRIDQRWAPHWLDRFPRTTP